MPVIAPNTGSTLGLEGISPNSAGVSNTGVNKTSVALTTNILITVNGTAVGAVQSMSVNETRPIKFFGEVGTDGHIDSAPSGSTTIGGNCQRIRFDRLRIAEAFGRGLVHARSQVYPFDIVILDKQKRNTDDQISTIIKNVWIKSINTTYSASDWIISDTMDWEAETVFSIRNGGGSTPSVAVGGERGIIHFGGGANGTGTLLMGDNGNAKNIEQLVDTGANGRRGSLSASGLIDIGDSGALF